MHLLGNQVLLFFHRLSELAAVLDGDTAIFLEGDQRVILLIGGDVGHVGLQQLAA
jgi:hypothetical protein